MALSLKDPETDRLAREIARLTGESLTEAVRTALAQRLQREKLRHGKSNGDLLDELTAIARHCASLPEFDNSSAEDIIGYDEDGIW